jgi:hypothetical protein
MKTKINRWLAKSRLVRRYEYLVEVQKLMEEFNTHRILQGGSDKRLGNLRNELMKTQEEIKSTNELINFLKNI